MNFDVCNGCSLCVMGCVGFQQSGDESVTAQARNLFLKSGGDRVALKDNLDHCVQSGYCTAVCPRGVDNNTIFTQHMNERTDKAREIFFHNWQRGKNLYGTSLRLNVEKKYALGGESFSLQLGCTFLHDHGHRIALIKEICQKYELPFYLKEQEVCCGNFLRDTGYGQLYKQACYENKNRLGTVFLDASCAHSSNHSFWDFLFQKNNFPSLKGQSLSVSTRWLNAQVELRSRLLEDLVAKTGIKLINQDGLFLASGGVQSAWRRRLGQEIPLINDLQKGALVMEVSEISGDNPWLLEEI